MSCACRVSILRIFLHNAIPVRCASTVALRPSRPPIKPTRHSQARSFSAVAASCYPRQPLPARSPFQLPTPLQVVDADDIAVDSAPSPRRRRAEASPAADDVPVSVDLDRARSDGVILDLSPQAIDALASPARKTQAKTSADKASAEATSAKRTAEDEKPPGDDEARPATGELRGPSRLKRSRIMPPNVTMSTEPVVETRRPPESWKAHRAALKAKFPEGWKPRKRLSPDAMEGVRALHAQFPEEYTTEKLSEKFEIDPEAIRRILKSKWRPSAEVDADRQERWFRRGRNIWSQMAELGVKPPRKWRAEGIVRDPACNEKKGPRTEWPYVPRHRAEEPVAESAHRKSRNEFF